MTAKRKRKQPSGHEQRKAAGKHPILLGVPQDKYALILLAAAIEQRPTSQFILYHAYNAAKDRVAEENRRNHWNGIQNLGGEGTPAVEP